MHETGKTKKRYLWENRWPKAIQNTNESYGWKWTYAGSGGADEGSKYPSSGVHKLSWDVYTNKRN